MSEFKKSSFCCGSGMCAEVALPEFRRASVCSVGACAEAAVSRDTVLMRQSEHRDVVLSFTPEEWRAFVKGVKAGEFDLPE